MGNPSGPAGHLPYKAEEFSCGRTSDGKQRIGSQRIVNICNKYRLPLPKARNLAGKLSFPAQILCSPVPFIFQGAGYTFFSHKSKFISPWHPVFVPRNRARMSVFRVQAAFPRGFLCGGGEVSCVWNGFSCRGGKRYWLKNRSFLSPVLFRREQPLFYFVYIFLCFVTNCHTSAGQSFQTGSFDFLFWINVTKNWILISKCTNFASNKRQMMWYNTYNIAKRHLRAMPGKDKV